MGWLAAMIITEEIARASSSLRVQVNMLELGCAKTILRYSDNEDVKKKYVPKLTSGEWLGGFGITEANAGSDVMAMKTTANRRRRPLGAERLQDLDFKRRHRQLQ